MKRLLEASKQQLMNPLGQARRRLLLILNLAYLICLPFFLVSEKLTTGKFVPEDELLYVYAFAFFTNLLSLLYNSSFIRNKYFSKDKINQKTLNRLDFLSGAVSIIPILIQSMVNMLGVGNPSNDAILTDFALALSLMIAVVIILGRTSTIIWAVVVLGALFYNVMSRGWDYEYHYLTPSEVVQFKKDLKEKKDYALKRQDDLKKAHLNPPRITRYFNVWLIFIVVTFLMAYFFSGITHDILKVVPTVVSNIEMATEESKTIEVERMLNQQKTTTFLNLAHETKTPLTLMNNYTDEYMKRCEETHRLINEFIQTQGDNEQLKVIKQNFARQSDDMKVIKNNIQRLTNDIVNFFDTERFSKGLTTYDHNQVCDISSILKTKVPLFKCYADGKQINLKENIEEGLFIKAHPGAVERIANNLIENALKYTKSKGTVEVKLSSQGPQLLFSVSDTGVGIPEEFQTKIFEQYYQLATTRKINEGMGLGLPIVKNIVEDIKAKLALNSEVNHGTTITVAFPKYVPAADEKIPFYTVSKQVNLVDSENIQIEPMVFDKQKSTILVLEDNLQMLSFIVRNLQDKFNVYHATDGKAALAQMEQGINLDLIISDVMMEGMDGFEFFEHISDERFGHIPFIFLTAKTNTEDKISGLKLGAMDYIEKPFDMQELITKAESLMLTMAKQKRNIISNALFNLKQHVPNFEFNGGHKAPALTEEKEVESFEERCKTYGLTPGEIRVIGEVVTGIPYKVVADNLHIAESTVRKHMENIFKKLDVSNKVEVMNMLMPAFS